jgi:hypothetical protein
MALQSKFLSNVLFFIGLVVFLFGAWVVARHDWLSGVIFVLIGSGIGWIAEKVR